jgi:transcriptional regulator with XRE-family HTH domain
LKEIRLGLGLSQGGLAKLLIEINHDLGGYLRRERISDFENPEGLEPDLFTLKAYADAAGISTDVLIDDDAKLPEKLPGAKHARGLMEKLQKRRAQAAMSTTVTLWLDIKSDNHATRDENRARKTIEKVYLEPYGMKKLQGHEYGLAFSYEDDADLDDQLYTLLGSIYTEARRRNCSIKVNAREKGSDRYW